MEDPIARTRIDQAGEAICSAGMMDPLTAVELDLCTIRSHVEELLAEAHGPVTVLVSGAANDQRQKLADLTPEGWDRNQAVNLKAYYFATQAAAPMMRAAGGGSIVNFSSISYMMGAAGYSAYAAANAGITGMTRAHARELGPDGIRVNALAPGWVLTERQLDLWATPEDLAVHLARQCIPRHLTPQDIVNPALFLASAASAMMTGQCMVVDGGVVHTG